MKRRGKQVDPKENVTEDASWGDIQLNKKQYNAIKENFDAEEKRFKIRARITAPNFKLIPNQKWPSEPIKFTTKYMKDKKKVILIGKALQEIQANTCIRFLHMKIAKGPHIEFRETNKNPGICGDSPLGMEDDKNVINIFSGCNDEGTYLHEILHSLGFGHTQERPDADRYITFNFDNVAEDQKSNFKPWAYALKDQGPYDYASIMHYDEYAFAINSSIKTMVPKIDPDINGPLMGNAMHLSEEDVRILNKIYCQDEEEEDPEENPCIDNNEGCAGWAENGLCETDEYMKDNCKFSCNICTRE